MKSLTIVIFSAALLSRAFGASGSPLHHWVQMGTKRNTILIRAIVESGDCPSVQYKKNKGAKSLTQPMHIKNTDKNENFPVKLCEAELSSSIFSAELEMMSLPLPKKNPKKILVIGDTGCRTKGFIIQNCNDPKEWPFAQVAQSAAQWKPDLILHLGDYHYRETPCPDGVAGCKGITAGDNWKSWQEDFFTPANTLLQTAPWVMVRGNHEACERGGQGWFQLMDPFSNRTSCSNISTPYAVSIGEQNMWIVDSADANSIQKSIAQIREKSSGKTNKIWTLTHRPFVTKKDNFTIPPNITLSLVGHLHRLGINTFLDSRPPEIIAGNSGDYLDPKPSALASDAIREVQHEEEQYNALERYDFGFLTMEKIRDGLWKITEHNVSGAAVIDCQFDERPRTKANIRCKKSG